MPVSRKRSSQKGFTLVELLIVVAIIGVLSTIGVPTFRKMVQKAKKTEAKVNLGGLFTAEQAFFSEYGAYGNNLIGIGFEIDGNANIYRIGYYGGAAAPGIEPANVVDTPGGALATAYPAYFVDSPATRAFFLGNPNAVPPANPVFGVGAGGINFIAGACGVIAPGLPNNNAANNDCWTMTQARALSNFQDGIR